MHSARFLAAVCAPGVAAGGAGDPPGPRRRRGLGDSRSRAVVVTPALAIAVVGAPSPVIATRWRP